MCGGRRRWRGAIEKFNWINETRKFDFFRVLHFKVLIETYARWPLMTPSNSETTPWWCALKQINRFLWLKVGEVKRNQVWEVMQVFFPAKLCSWRWCDWVDAKMIEAAKLSHVVQSEWEKSYSNSIPVVAFEVILAEGFYSLGIVCCAKKRGERDFHHVFGCCASSFQAQSD